MDAHRSRFPLLLGLGLLGAAGTAYAAQSLDVTIAGWTPIVTLWGGETKAAVRAIENSSRAFAAFLHNTDIDKPTQKFIDKSFKEFEDFDLKGFHDLLPDERNGHRELNVRGEVSGDRYLVTQASPGSNYMVGLDGPRNDLADMSLQITGKQNKTSDHESLLAGFQYGLGMGPLTYGGLMRAQRDLARMVTDHDPRGNTDSKPEISAAAKEFIRKNNPGLGAEDIDGLALLYQAFPSLGEVLTGVGRMEDLQMQPEGSYFHIKAKMRAEPDRLDDKYPSFAKHVKKLDDVLLANVRVLDDKGRDLVRLTVDSEKLLFGVEAYIKDGLALPFSDGQVFEDEPLDPIASTLEKPTVLVNARLEMLGIVINIKGLRVDARYEGRETYGTAEARITKMPQLKVEGRALGIFSPGFLDIFIPSNLEDITKKFFEIAVKGDGGKGIRAHIDLGARSDGGPGVLSATASAEIYESFIVKIGGSIVSDRLIMSEKASDQAKQLAADLYDAFMKDFAVFKQKVGGAG